MGMFGTAKPMASLSSGLLARKGQARPAMKPQGYAGLGPVPSLEDLGWNDMGAPVPAGRPPVETVAELPPVLVQREELAAAVELPAPEPDTGPDLAEKLPEPVAVADTRTDIVEHVARDIPRAGKAAFTLRLPADRHLRLRLTSAVQRRSAQAVVTDALDRYLATLPEVDDLARQCRPAALPSVPTTGNPS